MRIFQNSGISRSYIPRLDQLTSRLDGFAESRDRFIADRYGSCHILQPVLDGNPEAFFTTGNNISLQRKWALAQGLPVKTSLSDILRAQIEQHRTEVFYNLDPMRDSDKFTSKLPGCVKHSVAWRAAPSANADFSDYDLMVCNFPTILKSYTDKGIRSAYFTPAHDSFMDKFAANTDRSIDVLFVGGYSRHHRRRAETLEIVSALKKELNVVFHLDRSRLNRLAESPIGQLLPLQNHRRPPSIRAVSVDPVFGLDLYAAISTAKVVLNGAVDMAGNDRGNMRCFEAMGCGALMISDAGNYPAGMVDGKTMLAYKDANHAVKLIRHSISENIKTEYIAKQGWQLMVQHYGKAAQWKNFQQLVADL